MISAAATEHYDQNDDTSFLFDVWRLRLEARAMLVRSCAMDIIEAVDGLQSAAEEYGLVQLMGQDAIQCMMSEAFR